MPWYAWAIIIYIALDRLLMIALIGRSINITRGGAVLSMITGALFVWALLALANAS